MGGADPAEAGRIDGGDLDGGAYVVETSMIPLQTHDVRDADGDLVAGLDEPAFSLGDPEPPERITFTDADGTPVFEFRPAAGDGDFLGAEHQTVYAGADGGVLATLDRSTSLGKRTWRIESDDGTHLGTVSTGSRLGRTLSAVPGIGFSYEVLDADGRQVGSVTPQGSRRNRSYEVSLEGADERLTAAVLAGTLPLKLDEGSRAPSSSGTTAGGP